MSSKDDTKQPGFVSAIVMKFTQLSQGQKQLASPIKNENINNNRDQVETRLDKPKPLVFEVSNLTPDLSQLTPETEEKKFIETAKAQLNVDTTFEVVGEVSVKDRIKAYVALTSAFNKATQSPGVLTTAVAKKKQSITIETTPTQQLPATQIQNNHSASTTIAASHSQPEPTNSVVEKNTSPQSSRDTKVQDLLDRFDDSAKTESTVTPQKPLQPVTNSQVVQSETPFTTTTASTTTKSNLAPATTNTTDSVGSSKFDKIQSNSDLTSVKRIEDHKKTKDDSPQESSDSKDQADEGLSRSYDFASATDDYLTKDKISVTNTMNIDQLNISSKSDVSSVSSDLIDELDTSQMYGQIDDDYFPLPKSYKVSVGESGVISIILPPPPAKGCLKDSKPKKQKKKKNICIDDQLDYFETYSVYEYERGDEDLDPLTASAEYEIEKKTEQLVKFEVELTKDDKGLGLSIVGIGLGSDMGAEKLGIYIKALTPGGAAEKSKMLNVHDQILEVDGASLVGVTQALAAQTLKSTSKVVKFLIGREKDQVG